MSDVLKFPNDGYDVEVCRKQDIIDCLDTNVDKELVSAIITQCESDISDFIEQGIWAGIPYLGNIRVPKHKQKFQEINGAELLETAKETLTKQRYNIFKKELNTNIAINVKQERFYKYMTSCYVTKHRRTYNRLLRIAKYNNIVNIDSFARFICYSLIELNNYIPKEYGTD